MVSPACRRHLLRWCAGGGWAPQPGFHNQHTSVMIAIDCQPVLWHIRPLSQIGVLSTIRRRSGYVSAVHKSTRPGGLPSAAVRPAQSWQPHQARWQLDSMHGRTFIVCLTRCLGQGTQPFHEVCRHCTPIVATVYSSWTLWCKARPGKTLPGGALPQDSTSLYLPTSVLCAPVQPAARPRAACPRTGARRRTSVRGCARPRASR